MAELGLLCVFVERKEVRPQDDVYRLPSLQPESVLDLTQLRKRAYPTFVFFVRLRTKPDLSTLSNSKLPFWLTGEKVSRLR